MMDKLILTNNDCRVAAIRMSNGFQDKRQLIYGVPRGGVPVAYLLLAALAHPDTRVIENPESATVIVDDIVDTGRTRNRYREKYNDTPFIALADFLTNLRQPKQWVVFPWEQGLAGEDQSADDIVIRLLQYIGEDPTRGGLKETPKRVLKAWKEWTSGYGVDPSLIMKQFEDGAEEYTDMVVNKDIPFYSHCEHHMAPFFGTATIAYIPSGRVLGLSKLSRVLDVFARRLQVQERMTAQVADALHKHIQGKGVGVVIKARHMCMETRGICKTGHHTITSALRGEFLTDPAVRNEFLSLSR